MVKKICTLESRVDNGRRDLFNERVKSVKDKILSGSCASDIHKGMLKSAGRSCGAERVW